MKFWSTPGPNYNFVCGVVTDLFFFSPQNKREKRDRLFNLLDGIGSVYRQTNWHSNVIFCQKNGTTPAPPNLFFKPFEKKDCSRLWASQVLQANTPSALGTCTKTVEFSSPARYLFTTFILTRFQCTFSLVMKYHRVLQPFFSGCFQ